MTRIAIVGGGITGLATKALVNNANVVLYEASNRLGGILKDYKIDKSSFFTSCQYFSGESSWFERMDLFSDFYEFSHTYGSYTDIFGSETLSNNFAEPTYSGNSLRFSQAEQPLPKKLIERLSLYPEVIENGLRKWFQFIELMQMSHINQQ